MTNADHSVHHSHCEVTMFDPSDNIHNSRCMHGAISRSGDDARMYLARMDNDPYSEPAEMSFCDLLYQLGRAEWYSGSSVPMITAMMAVYYPHEFRSIREVAVERSRIGVHVYACDEWVTRKEAEGRKPQTRDLERGFLVLSESLHVQDLSSENFEAEIQYMLLDYDVPRDDAWDPKLRMILPSGDIVERNPEYALALLRLKSRVSYASASSTLMRVKPSRLKRHRFYQDLVTNVLDNTFGNESIDDEPANS